MDDEVVAVQATCSVIIGLLTSLRTILMLITNYYLWMRRRRNHRNRRRYSIRMNVTRQLENVHYLVNLSDEICRDHLRMNRDCFNRLCFLLENLGGLSPTRHVTIAEQVAMFLLVLAHHTKNRIVKSTFLRSGYTVSKHFNSVLNTLLKLYTRFIVTPHAVPDDCTDSRWKYFKGCLGALDGTYIPVKVPAEDVPRYRNRKGNVSVNVLAVCDQNMNYIYVLSGWEGSAADSRVLRDAVTQENGLRVPNGNYYLVDGGYTNGNGFLAPYRGFRYHLREWDSTRQGPQNYQEYFNIKHAKARNVIERSFGILKARWGILRSNSYYPINTHNRIILGCCLLHNFIRSNMDVDPIEDDVPEISSDDVDVETNGGEEFIDGVETSQAWTNWRDNFAIMDLNQGTSRGKNTEKASNPRRVWTYEEEKVLRVGSNFDVAKKRAMVYETLGQFDFLTLEDKVNVSQHLCNNLSDLDMFFSFPNDAKAVLVKKIMKI
ncbi:hypothetical protein ACS0TY_003206 [Phlomoides rotata]